MNHDSANNDPSRDLGALNEAAQTDPSRHSPDHIDSEAPTEPPENSGEPMAQDNRVFLGLEQPPLISATDWLVHSYQSENFGPLELDLSNFIIVLPTLRAQHRLLQLLIQKTDELELVFTPPIITSLGQLPEHLYEAAKPLATDLAQQIAWSKALELSPKKEIECLTGRAEVEDLQDWQPLATLISKLHSRLANDIWSFSSVAREVKSVKGFLKEEAARWDALDAIQQRYYVILHEVELWDKQAARNYAAAGLLKNNEIRCSTDKNIVMLGTADLNRSVSEMLRQIAHVNPNQVNILVAAEGSMADRFDNFGSLITDQWLSTPIEISNDQILIVDQPADQSDAAAHYISNLLSKTRVEFAADEITIGVPDQTVVPQLERSLNAICVANRSLAGRPLAETGPVRLMIACRDFLESQSYNAFASLVRHPDMFRWLSVRNEQDGWLKSLDEYQNRYLPNRLPLENEEPFGSPEKVKADFDPKDEKSEARAARRAQSVRLLNQLHDNLGELLKPLLGEPQPIANWAPSWSEILIQIYGERMMDKNDPGDRQIIKACDAVYTALGNQKQVPEKFETETSASQALDWAIEAATEHRVVDPPVPDAIELAGWLDLPLDDAPVMVVTSMNDEHVPTAEIGHQFLPNELCKTLNILDNDRRYARDAYALTVITSVREHFLLIAGRRDEKGEPKKPSRLLFSTDHQTAARRAKAYFSYKGKSESRHWIRPSRQFQEAQQLEIPQPIDVEPINKLAVTRFKEFIECPYRFYLKHVMKLDTIVDDWRELSGGTFGDLTHNVLEAFGQSEIRDSTDAREIAEFLNRKLDQFVEQDFFGSRLPAVRIQIEQLRLRYEKMAHAQAKHRLQGWRIVSTEEHLFHEFHVDGSPFILHGKIDRVDQHDATGQVAVWDYKSSDNGWKPGPAHYMPRKKEWKNLQLPLYRHLVKEVSAVAGADFSNMIMGYVLLPKKLDEVGFHEAEWTREELLDADETARAIIRKLRQSIFWPPNPRPPQYTDFAAISQDNVFEQFDVSMVGEEAPPW